MVVKISGFYKPSIPTVTWDPELKMLVAKEKTRTEQSGLGTWMFTYIDLIIVVAIAKCAVIMKMCVLSLHTIMFVTTIITVLFVTRLQIDDYCNRFYTNDVFHRILYFAYMLCFFIMALNLDVTYTSTYEPSDYLCQSNMYGYGFGSAFVTTRVITFLLQGSAIMADKTHVVAKQFAMELFRSTISAGVAFIQDLVVNSGDEYDPSGRYQIYVSCMAIEMMFYIWHHIALYHQDTLCSWTIEIQEVYYQIGEYLVGREACPIDVDEYSERMSAFVMVVLGQMVALTTLVYYNETSEKQYDDFSMLSLWLVFLYGVLYFDCASPEALVPPEEEEEEDGKRKKGKMKKKDKQREIEDKVDRWKAGHDSEGGDIGMPVIEVGSAKKGEKASLDKGDSKASSVIIESASGASTGSGGNDSKEGEEGVGKESGSEGTPASGGSGESEGEGEGKEERENEEKKRFSLGEFGFSGFSLSSVSGKEGAAEGSGNKSKGSEGELPSKRGSGSFWDLGSVATGRSYRSNKSSASAKSNASSVSNASSRADTLPERRDGDTLEEAHAMNHSLLSSFLYTWLHLLLCLAMFFGVTAVTVIYSDEIKVDPLPAELVVPSEYLTGAHEPMMSPGFLLALSIFMSLITLTLLRLITNGLEQLWLPKADGGRSIRINTGLKVFLAFTHLLVPSFNMTSAAGVCTLHGFLLTLSVCAQIRFVPDAALNPLDDEEKDQAKDNIEALRDSVSVRRRQIEQMAAIDGGAIMTDNPLHKSSKGAKEIGINNSSSTNEAPISPPKSPPRIEGISEANPDRRAPTRDKIAFLAKRRKMGLKTGTRSVPASSANVAPLGLGLPPPKNT